MLKVKSVSIWFAETNNFWERPAEACLVRFDSMAERSLIKAIPCVIEALLLEILLNTSLNLYSLVFLVSL